MTKSRQPQHSEAGTTLVEILVALALLGVGTTIFIQYSKTILANRNAAEMIRERTLIRTMLINSTACEKALACKGSELRELKDTEGRTLVNDQGTSTYGNWQVQAQCQPDKSIQVNVTSSINGKFKIDPVTRKPLNLKNKAGLLLQPGALCGKLEKKKALSTKITTLRSARCTVGQGTCPPPPEYPNATTKMCCDDGSDMPKPVCTGATRLLSSYWDREGSWGLEGSWVVLCQ